MEVVKTLISNWSEAEAAVFLAAFAPPGWRPNPPITGAFLRTLGTKTELADVVPGIQAAQRDAAWCALQNTCRVEDAANEAAALRLMEEDCQVVSAGGALADVAACSDALAAISLQREELGRAHSSLADARAAALLAGDAAAAAVRSRAGPGAKRQASRTAP
jgi:hypothetical protein